MSAVKKPSKRTVLLTATDTGVGKTFVGAALVHRLVSKHAKRRVVAIKPVESGCDSVSPGAQEDGVLLAQATGQQRPRAALTRLRAPLAPPEAADREPGVGRPELAIATWCGVIDTLAHQNDITLIEGAGGLLSPLTWTETALDLAICCNGAALIVVPDRLGCLNHTLLTLSALSEAGVPCLGVVFNAQGEPDHTTGNNEATLRRFANIKHTLSLPRLNHVQEAAPLLDPVVTWVFDWIDAKAAVE